MVPLGILVASLHIFLLKASQSLIIDYTVEQKYLQCDFQEDPNHIDPISHQIVPRRK